MSDVEETQDAADLRLVLMALGERTELGERTRGVVAARLASVHNLELLATEYARRLRELEAVNAGEPKRVVFEAAHSILERISKLESSTAGLHGALTLQADEADRLDRFEATRNAALQGLLANPENMTALKGNMLAVATCAEELARHVHDMDKRPEPHAAISGELPKAADIRESESVAKSKAAKAAAHGGALQAYIIACGRLADAALALCDATCTSEWAAEMATLAEAALPFRYDSKKAVQPAAVIEWQALQDIVLKLATGDLAGGPDWLMTLRDRAKALLAQRGG